MKKSSILLIFAASCLSLNVFAANTSAINGIAAGETHYASLPESTPARNDIKDYALTDASAYTMAQPLMVNGKTLEAKPLLINGCVLVPARAVDDALGFETLWNGQDQSVTIKGTHMQTVQYLGIDYSNAVTTIPGAVGATSPTSFGAAPILVNNTAYVPLEIYMIIQGNNPEAVTVTDSAIEINAL